MALPPDVEAFLQAEIDAWAEEWTRNFIAAQNPEDQEKLKPLLDEGVAQAKASAAHLEELNPKLFRIFSGEGIEKVEASATRQPRGKDGRWIKG